jgi:hypothetical protein
LQLIDKVWHYQNAPSVLGTLQRTHHVGSRKAAPVFSQKEPLLNFSLGVSQLIKMAPSILKNTVRIVFGAVIVSVTLVGTSLADMHHICR